MPQPTALSLWFGGTTGISNVLDISTATAVAREFFVIVEVAAP